MDVPTVIRQRLADRGLEQRDLATAAQVTESYISQLLTRKKAPPAPNRTDLYDKIEPFLGLPHGELAKLADLQRQEALHQRLGNPLTPPTPNTSAPFSKNRPLASLNASSPRSC
jgi:transcriptional regulator with XRE-family HTH domain